MSELRIGLAPLARVNYDLQLARQIAHGFRAQLIMRGLKVAGSGDLVTDLAGAEAAIQQLSRQDFDLLLIFQATFTDNRMIIALAEAIDRPVFLWAVPEEAVGDCLRLNSLSGANLAAHTLTLLGKSYEYAYAHPDDPAAFERLRSITAAAQVYRRLKGARIGLIGQPPAGLDTRDFDEAQVKSRLGVKIVPFSLQAVIEQVSQVGPETALEIRRRLEHQVSKLDQVDQAPLERSLAAYAVLREIAHQEKLDGLAIRCWPELFTGLQSPACGPMSLHSDEYFPSSCEADVNGTITQLVLHWLSGGPALEVDIVSADFTGNTVTLWRCGQALQSMASPQDPPEGAFHSNHGLPLRMQFSLKPGRITLARFSRTAGELRLVLGCGEVRSTPLSSSGTSGVVRFESSARHVLDTLLSEGLENHLSLAYGDHVPSMVSLAKMLHLPILRL